MLKKYSIILIMILLLIGLGEKVFATDKQTATSTINGVTVKWEYTVDENGKIKNLVCKNVADLSGKVEVPYTIDGKTVEDIGPGGFESAKNIAELTIPSSIKKINSDAFKNCTNLTKVDLGNIESIGGNAFMGCTSLTSIKIPKTLTDAGYYYAVFNGCTSLTEITFEDGATVIPAMLCKSTNITEVKIPSSVKKIGFESFGGCKELTKITILDNVESIDKDAFRNHNEDLTIYCYEGSAAAKYAIDNDIKYVYLERASVEELTATVTYNPTTSTINTVTATIKTNKKVNKVEGWILSEDEKTLTKEYTTNATETIHLVDIDGMTKDVEIKITNIKSATSKQDRDDEKNTTIAKEVLPKTGVNIDIFIASIIALILVALVLYKKYNSYKDIK